MSIKEEVSYWFFANEKWNRVMFYESWTIRDAYDIIDARTGELLWEDIPGAILRFWAKQHMLHEDCHDE